LSKWKWQNHGMCRKAEANYQNVGAIYIQHHKYHGTYSVGFSRKTINDVIRVELPKLTRRGGNRI
jgi:hypothetical protein